MSINREQAGHDALLGHGWTRAEGKSRKGLLNQPRQRPPRTALAIPRMPRGTTRQIRLRGVGMISVAKVYLHPDTPGATRPTQPTRNNHPNRGTVIKHVCADCGSKFHHTETFMNHNCRTHCYICGGPPTPESRDIAGRHYCSFDCFLEHVIQARSSHQ